MKKLLLAAAVASLSVTAAQAAPTVYGKINLGLDQVDNADWKGGNRGEVNSNSSRIGFKGEEKLTDSMSAVYQMEWEVSMDGSGQSTDLNTRNRFLGLKFNNIGTVKAGKYDSYFKTAAGDNQDIFNDHNYLDMTNVIYGEERLNNVVGFELDKNLLAGVQFNIMMQQGESTSNTKFKNKVSTTTYSPVNVGGTIINNPTTKDTGAVDTTAYNYTFGTDLVDGEVVDTKARNSFGSAVSTSVLYDNKNLGLALGAAANFGIAGKYNSFDGGANKMASDAYRLTASYDFSNIGFKGFTLGGLWQTAQLSSPAKTATELDTLKEDAYTITAAYAIPSTKWTVKAEYVNANTTWDKNGTGVKVDRTMEQYGVGVDYTVNKQAKMYAVAAQQNRDWVASHDNRNVYGVGMIYNF